jgi:hypothetical protein
LLKSLKVSSLSMSLASHESREETNMKRSCRIIALAVGLFAMVGVILPPWPQYVRSQGPVKSANATYRFTLYCSRVSGRDNCAGLEDVNAQELESISKAISAIGPSGVEINACAWTALNCVPDRHEGFRAVIRNLVGTVLVLRSDSRTGARWLTMGAPEAAPGIRQVPTNESKIVVVSGPKQQSGTQ